MVCLALWAGVRAEAVDSGTGRVLHVCHTGAADFATIQSALDAATSGDTILVQPGVYRESLRFNGKNVTLTSTDPDSDAVVAATIIQSDLIHATVTFRGDESADCLLTGFVITGGGEAGVVGLGQGPDASASRATLRRNIIAGNGGTRAGGVFGMAGLIEHCAITGNVGEYGGALVQCDGVIRHCLVAGNGAENGPAGLVSCHGVLENLTIVDNTGQPSCCNPWNGAGLSDSQATVRDTVIWGNRIGREDSQIDGQVELVGSLIEGGDSPRVMAPTYVDKAAGDLRLAGWVGVGAEDFVQAESRWVWFPTSEVNAWARYWVKEYAREKDSGPFSIEEVASWPPRDEKEGEAGLRDGLPNDHFLVFIRSHLHSDTAVMAKLVEYLNDISGITGWRVYVVTGAGTTAQEKRQNAASIRSTMIANSHGTGNFLGALFIGAIDAPYYELWDIYGHHSGPTDMYYMDLDGDWADIRVDDDGTSAPGSNDIYDTHTAGTGSMEAECFVGRIDASRIYGGSTTFAQEKALTIAYFDRLHAYRQGFTGDRFGLSFRNHSDPPFGTTYIMGATHPNLFFHYNWSEPGIISPSVFITGYLCTQYYDAMDYYGHGGPYWMRFVSGGVQSNLTSLSLLNHLHSASTPSMPFFNFLYSCRACAYHLDFSYYGAIGSILNIGPNSRGLVTIGKVVNVNGCQHVTFYNNIASGMCYGDAYRAWINDIVLPSSIGPGGFHNAAYKMHVLLGDPLLAY